MVETRYRGLAEFGLPLVGKDDGAFDALVKEIDGHPGPGIAQPLGVPEQAAVLVNHSGRAIIGMEWLWRFTGLDGQSRTHQFSSFGSSAQREVLSGRSQVGRDIGTFILPGSKRLMTKRGIFGSNLDVLAAEELPRAQGYCGGWGGGSTRESGETELAAVELVLDLVVLEDGLCVGPDESGLFEALNESLDLQQATAAEAVRALRAGASVGQIFEIVRPLAGHRARRGQRSVPLVQTFGSEAIHHLINADGDELMAFFERVAAPRSLELRRPGSDGRLPAVQEG